jgi:hypothetical protein
MANGSEASVAALTIGLAPSLAMGFTYSVAAQSIGEVMTNAAVAEKNMQIIAAAATVVVNALIIKAGTTS